jgi:hypothetical protein
MAPTTLKIKMQIWKNGDSIAGLAADWGFTRSLLTMVIHGKRSNGPQAKKAKKRLERYVASTARKAA